VDDPSATITLIGRSSAWGLRVSALQPRQWAQRQATLHDSSRVVMAWLHHRSYGTLGVYLAEHASDLRLLPPPRQWLRVRGQFQPWRVHAQPDDPRSAVDPDLTPLALVVSDLTLVERADLVHARGPLLLRPQHVRLLTGRRCGRGVIAPVAQQPDLSYWKTVGTPPAIATWNRIVGVVSSLGTTRYLRYVLSASRERMRDEG
jgi:hypothetical protein